MNVSFFVCSCVHSVCVSVFFALFCIVVICCLLSPSTEIGTPKRGKSEAYDMCVCVCCYCLIRPVESIRAIALLLRHFAVRKLKPRATECSHASTLTHLNVYAYVMIIWIFRLCVCRQWVQDLQSYLSVLLVYNRCSFRQVDKKQQQQQPLHCMNKITETVSALYAPFTLYAQLNFDSMHNKNAENFVRATYSPATYDNGHKCTHANTMFFFAREIVNLYMLHRSLVYSHGAHGTQKNTEKNNNKNTIHTVQLMWYNHARALLQTLPELNTQRKYTLTLSFIQHIRRIFIIQK